MLVGPDLDISSVIWYASRSVHGAKCDILALICRNMALDVLLLPKASKALLSVLVADCIPYKGRS